MTPTRAAPKTIEEYIGKFPPKERAILRSVRRTIRSAAPGAEERISYGIPAFWQNGILVYFGGFKHHVGLYPPIRGDARLDKSLERYRGPKGNLQFPLDEPMPHRLISRIVKLRVKQTISKRPQRAQRARRTTS